MLKKNFEQLYGNDRYEGFIPDLLLELKKLDPSFSYILTVVKDRKYGSKLSNGSWSGMVGEILSGVANVAAADLSMTAQRKEVLDFTPYFMMSGIGVIKKKNDPPEVDLWFFVKPFAPQVWLCTLIAFLGVTIIMFILGRFSGADWNNPDPREERKNNLNVANSLYFIFASLVFQNSKIAPRGAATRILACIWWFFSLILICYYVANLAAMLVKKMDLAPELNEIKNIDELSRQTKVKYGLITGGSTYSFFKNSQLPVYKLLFDEMENAEPSAYVQNYTEGLRRVKRGNYAFFMEHSFIMYELSRDCDLIQIGSLLNYRGYGLAFKKGDSKVHNFSVNIMKLEENGILHRLREKWWRKSTGNVCEGVEDEARGALGISSVAGIFLLLFAGFLFAFLIAILELCWKVRMKDGVSNPWNEFVRESKYALCGEGPNSNTNGKRNVDHEEGINLDRQEEAVIV